MRPTMLSQSNPNKKIEMLTSTLFGWAPPGLSSSRNSYTVIDRMSISYTRTMSFISANDIPTWSDRMDDTTLTIRHYHYSCSVMIP
jgi:hypothetical protein